MKSTEHKKHAAVTDAPPVRSTIFSNRKTTAFGRFPIVPLVIPASRATGVDFRISIDAYRRDNRPNNPKKMCRLETLRQLLSVALNCLQIRRRLPPIPSGQTILVVSPLLRITHSVTLPNPWTSLRNAPNTPSLETRAEDLLGIQRNRIH